jgi:hypothetical protein
MAVLIRLRSKADTGTTWQPASGKALFRSGPPGGLRRYNVGARSPPRNPRAGKFAQKYQLFLGFFERGCGRSGNLRGAADVLEYSMRFRSIGYVAIVSISFLMSGCAIRRYVSMSDIWRAQEVRQHRLAREAGRIGYIGNAGPALGTSLPSSSN